MSILGDWGTTRLRLYRQEEGVVVDRLEGPGIGQLAAAPGEALAATLAPWAGLAAADGVTLCGMAGSRNGLVEVPYARCPADAEAWARASATTVVDGYRVTVAAGLSTANLAGRADVMRGEETQIFGAVALDPTLAAGEVLILLPGTHSKWALLTDGRIERFHSFPTGEVFALLRDHSTLTRAGSDAAGREEGFTDGLARARETGLLAALFEARAAQLLEGRTLGWASGLLSGLLIGAEFGEGLALLDGVPGRLALIGDPVLSALYARAAADRDIPPEVLDGDACVLAGLALLNRRRP